jgi:hypothetical protein
MTKAKTPKQHPKLINQFMVYDGINEINDVFGILIALKAYIKSEDFNKYHAQMIVSSIQSLLCNGTLKIEEWLEIEDEVTK